MPVDGRYEAVLDEQTGLIWEREVGDPNTGDEDRSGATWYEAMRICITRSTGGRYGWRLPAVWELGTLLDSHQAEMEAPSLPAGHPFAYRTGARWVKNAFWTATEYVTQSDELNDRFHKAWAIVFVFGGVVFDAAKGERRMDALMSPTFIMSIWCVRDW